MKPCLIIIIHKSYLSISPPTNCTINFFTTSHPFTTFPIVITINFYNSIEIEKCKKGKSPLQPTATRIPLYPPFNLSITQLKSVLPQQNWTLYFIVNKVKIVRVVLITGFETQTTTDIKSTTEGVVLKGVGNKIKSTKFDLNGLENRGLEVKVNKIQEQEQTKIQLASPQPQPQNNRPKIKKLAQRKIHSIAPLKQIKQNNPTKARRNPKTQQHHQPSTLKRHIPVNNSQRSNLAFLNQVNSLDGTITQIEVNLNHISISITSPIQLN